MAVRFSTLRSGRPLPPGRFLVLISVRGWVDPQVHNAAGRIRSIEKSNDLIRNRTRDLPACSRVPRPTALQRAHTQQLLPVQNISVCFIPRAASLMKEKSCEFNEVSGKLVWIPTVCWEQDLELPNCYVIFLGAGYASICSFHILSISLCTKSSYHSMLSSDLLTASWNEV
jgi:hypothetical protein